LSLTNKILSVFIVFTVFVLGGFVEYHFGNLSFFYDNHRQSQMLQSMSQEGYKPFDPVQEYWKEIPLQNNDLTLQLMSKDVKIKEVGLSGSLAYTGSMRPTMYGGNRLLTVKYEHAGIPQDSTCLDIKEGQIISYKAYEDDDDIDEIVHRVIDNEVGAGVLITRADVLHKGGEEIKCEDITEIVVGVLYT